MWVRALETDLIKRREDVGPTLNVLTPFRFPLYLVEREDQRARPDVAAMVEQRADDFQFFGWRLERRPEGM